MLIWTLVIYAFRYTVNSAIGLTVNSAIGLTVNSAISINPTANSAIAYTNCIHFLFKFGIKQDGYAPALDKPVLCYM